MWESAEIPPPDAGRRSACRTCVYLLERDDRGHGDGEAEGHEEGSDPLGGQPVQVEVSQSRLQYGVHLGRLKYHLSYKARQEHICE